MTAAHPHVRVLHVYPEHLNIYADRGNISVLRTRAAWHGLELSVTELGLGERFTPGEHDLIYLGGGQDRDQARIAPALRDDLGEALREAVLEGTAVLAVCGGYQLLGRGYLDTHGERLEGVEVFDADTVAGDTRLIGNVVIDVTLPAIGERPAVPTQIAGFENHAGRTTLGADARALGSVVHGGGNDGESGAEGCRLHHAIGTYLHGPLLPRNPALSDWLLAAAAAHAGGLDSALSVPVDASANVPAQIRELEVEAHEVLVGRARRER